MIRVAVPIFKSRISPVFDTCTRVLVIDFDQDREIQREEIYLDKFSLSERVSILQNLQVTTFICGGISEVFHKMLRTPGNRLISGIAGEVEEILAAFLSDRLYEPQFQMPGYKTKK